MRVIKWIFVIISLLISLPIAAAAQIGAEISGTVRSQIGLVLPGVTVRFEPGGASGVTDERGAFQLDVVAADCGPVRTGHPEQELLVGRASPHVPVASVLLVPE